MIIAAHRSLRPWSGDTVVEADSSALETYQPDCYLCPGNLRAGGERNPDYSSTYVFDNDFPPIGPLSPTATSGHGVFTATRAQGMARVVCAHPNHSLTLAEMSAQEIFQVMVVWAEQYRELGARPEIKHVLIFENKGKIVGVSNPHPHCQIYATNFVMDITAREVEASSRYLAETGRVLLSDILIQEREDDQRIVAENDTAIAFVPYFARYTYEVYVAPLTHRCSIAEMTTGELVGLADVLKTVLVKYDNLFEMPFPYVMALHQSPTDGENHDGFYFHIEIHPPLRNPSTLKYLAGAELGGGNIINPSLPEGKAEELRSASDIHYKNS